MYNVWASVVLFCDVGVGVCVWIVKRTYVDLGQSSMLWTSATRPSCSWTRWPVKRYRRICPSPYAAWRGGEVGLRGCQWRI